MKPLKIIVNMPKPMKLPKSQGKAYRPITQITSSGLREMNTSISGVTMLVNKISKFCKGIKSSLLNLL